MKQRVERVFAGPAEPEAGESDADLGDGKQFFGLREKGESDVGARVAFFGEMAQAGIADGEQRHFGRGEEGVDHEDQPEQEEARDVVGGGGHSVTKCKECCEGEFGRAKKRTHLWRRVLWSGAGLDVVLSRLMRCVVGHGGFVCRLRFPFGGRGLEGRVPMLIYSLLD